MVVRLSLVKVIVGRPPSRRFDVCGRQVHGDQGGDLRMQCVQGQLELHALDQAIGHRIALVIQRSNELRSGIARVAARPPAQPHDRRRKCSRHLPGWIVCQ